MRIRQYFGLRFYVKTPVGNAEIKFSVRPKLQSMQIMPSEGYMDSEAMRQRLALVRHAIVILVPKKPKVRDTGKINIAFPGQYSSRHSGHARPEIFGEGDRFIRHRIAIFIDHQSNPFGFDFQITHVELPISISVHDDPGGKIGIPRNEDLSKEIRAIGHGSKGEIIGEPLRMISYIEHRSPAAM